MEFNSSEAFARAWDAKNPSAFKQACEHSRALREDHAARLDRSVQFLFALGGTGVNGRSDKRGDIEDPKKNNESTDGNR